MEKKMLIDTHCHLDDEAFANDVANVVAAARNAGVERMITQGTSISSSLDCIALAEEFPEVYAAIAIHPNCLMEELPALGSDDVFLDIFTKMAENPRVRAIGETGVDLYWHDTPVNIQKKFLALHFELSRRTQLPVIIHCRDAEEDLLKVARNDFDKNGPVPGVIHSFSGNTDFLKACLELDFHISYSGSVTFKNKCFDSLRGTVPLVPENRLLVETDSPYLTPMPFRGKIKRNTPEMVTHTARFIAEIRGISEENIQETTTQNTKKLFQID
ncbi:MAG: TatD family deoxyribonuclease [Planctomycetaceae bacterium]|nr:TatD family deoxyribonuclease [Planctomycetaceae bacterium]